MLVSTPHLVGARSHLRLQILSIAVLIVTVGAEVKMPPQYGTFKQARRVQSSQTDIERRFCRVGVSIVGKWSATFSY